MYNSVIRFKFFSLKLALTWALVSLVICAPMSARAAQDYRLGVSDWSYFEKTMKEQKRRDFDRGLSYVISGSLALVGGLAGANATQDSVEKGVYTVFETIGISSVGYGAYTMQIGSEERELYEVLVSTKLSAEQKTEFLHAYYYHRMLTEKKERLIKALTHALIAGLNLYSASQQQQPTIRTGLYFVGGVNLLAALTFTFDF